MTLKQAIAAAKALRPGPMPDAEMAAALWRLDGELAERIGADAPAAAFPDDRTLLLAPPYDDLYVSYLACRADEFAGDDALFAADTARYNARLDETLARLRRDRAKAQPRFVW
ncbi:MAG: hypothetical protein IJT07_03270 [Oscillospiraceae bacterium]|nr:hypothetical protein [Oscillospiraceae bacterium]